MSKSSEAIIIGAGVAGMASAVRLAAQGFDVSVYEKNAYAGGKLAHFKLGDFSFDAGPSLFTQVENLIELFDLCNEPINEYLKYEKVPLTCKYFFENGTIVNAYGDAERFALEMQEKTGEDYQRVLSYLRQSEDAYNNIGRVFLEHSLHRIKDLLKAPLSKAIRATKGKYIFGSLNQLNLSHFTRPESVQLFNRFATYNGSNPYQAPGMLSLIPHLELNQGTYYPKGGMRSITDALYRLAIKKGVRFYFDCPVQRIINVEGRIQGVVVDDQNVPADLVISNIDVYYTYKQLLNDTLKATKLLRQERSSSALIFYWGIGRSFPELELHNIFFSKDYRAEFDQLFKSKDIHPDPTVYINITSKMEGGHAPAGKENWFVMVNAPSNEKQNWDDLKKQCREAVISKLSRLLKTDIAPLIEVEETLDPLKIQERTASYRGALYGTSSNSKFAAFLRHPNFSKSIRGLYFAGGTVHPGGGIPLCLKSAKLVSELIKDDRKTLVQHH